MNSDCIFCKIANGEIPSSTIYEDEMFRVILDLSPATKGHALILPKKHMANIFEMDEETAEKIFVLASRISKAMKEALNCDGLNIIQNNGEIGHKRQYFSNLRRSRIYSVSPCQNHSDKTQIQKHVHCGIQHCHCLLSVPFAGNNHLIDAIKLIFLIIHL